MEIVEVHRKEFSFKNCITAGQVERVNRNCFLVILAGVILLVSSTKELCGQTTFFRLSNYGLEEQANYGWSCATNGEFVVAGGPHVSYSLRGKKVTEGGKVIIYRKLQGKWVPGQELHNPALDHYGWFGSDVEMNHKHLVVSAHGYLQGQ